MCRFLNKAVPDGDLQSFYPVDLIIAHYENSQFDVSHIT